MENVILMTDSYKNAHWQQYDPEVKGIYSYIEARKSPEWSTNEVIVFGVAPFVEELKKHVVTLEMIDEAEEVAQMHGDPFNRAGWLKVVNEYNGKLPVVINAVPEGARVKVGVPIVWMYCTDPDLFWLVGHLETAFLRSVWYGSTVATLSNNVRRNIMNFLERSCDNPEDEIDFRLHDFGGRGVGSSEQAQLGALAHSLSFSGSDTLESFIGWKKWYNDYRNGSKVGPNFSVPAAEHSTITSWGRDREKEAFENMVELYGEGLYSVVSDSYDVFNAVDNIVGVELKDKIIEKGGVFIVRPDSGEPRDVLPRLLQSLEESFGVVINSKGYKVLQNVRIIWGDGMNIHTIQDIYAFTLWYGYSAENVVVGMGGGLLQKVDRDMYGFSFKASAVLKNDKWVDISKDPITDSGKKSKGGLVRSAEGKNGYEYVNSAPFFLDEMKKRNLLTQPQTSFATAVYRARS